MAWQQKAQRYKITDPYHVFLIAKYEDLIDWNGAKVQSPEALDAHLKEVMLPRLKERITEGTKRSHYCTRIDLARMLQNPAPHIEEARKIRSQGGDAAARDFLLGHINTHKKDAFVG